MGPRDAGRLGRLGQGLTMGLGMLLMLVFWGAVIVGFVLLERWALNLGSGPQAGREESSLEILRRRYARGELTREEYQRIREDIEQRRETVER